MEELKTVSGDLINTKEMMIKTIVHTSNHEQIDVHSLWVFEEACRRYDIDPTKFYQDNRGLDQEAIEKYGVRYWFYDDGEFAYTKEDYDRTWKENMEKQRQRMKERRGL